VQVLNQCCRLLFASVICGSLVSCSLFRPKEKDDDTWGDPHWEFNGQGGTQAKAGAVENRSDRKFSELENNARMVASNQPIDYWPTTQELEARGGNLTMEDYEHTAETALHSLTESGAGQSSGMVEESFSLPELDLPVAATTEGGDPLAGFWEEDSSDNDKSSDDDFSDDTIQKAGAAQEDEPFPATTASSVDSLSAEVGKVEPPPIPPLSSFSAEVVADKSMSADVVLLDAETPVIEAAFNDLSILNTPSLSAPSSGRADSFLDRRERVSLSDVGRAGDGPLSAPSIETEVTPRLQ
jgi:hypothetical protein